MSDVRSVAAGLLAGRLSRPGRVLRSVDGEVLVDIAGGCNTCAQPCLGGLMQSRSRHIGVADAVTYNPGTWVDVVLEKNVLTKACALVFGLPLVGLLAGAVVGAAAVDSALQAEFGAAIGGAAGALGVLVQRRRLRDWIKLDLIPSR